MKLSQLTEELSPKKMIPPVSGHGVVSMDPEIESIHYRSSEVRPGGLFVAVRGFATDGHGYIEEAISRGAVAIVAERPLALPVVLVEVPNSRKALAVVADRYYQRPSEKLVVIAVTGTNGKTTTASLIESILRQVGFETGLISTVFCRYAGKTHDNPMTTPESLDLQSILARMLASGVTHVVMEASSHAIDLFRIQNCRLDVAVFTNLSQDHLDFHGNMQAYWQAKKRLFTDYLPAGAKGNRATAVINCSSEKGRELFALLSGNAGAPQILGVGGDPGLDLRPLHAEIGLGGISGTMETPSGTFAFHSPLAGGYNLENILCAAGAGFALHIPLERIQAGIERFTSVPGRLEAVPDRSGRFVFIDYAHTPDALENVLTTLRAVATGRIICIFGCGGDRDKSKRPLMGRISMEHADLTIVTSDNPRSEEPLRIIEDIVNGIRPLDPYSYGPETLENGIPRSGFLVEPDRREAIRKGIQAAVPGDTVLIAGKGHEKYQIVGKQKLPFDDFAIAQQVIEVGDA
ncbi:MAG: UDP-N-acetylmuramoyl-L-alanyl-D-glutamate--2,6-diaminopimelate ligase [Thermodesulfobacteriota bacterium]